MVGTKLHFLCLNCRCPFVPNHASPQCPCSSQLMASALLIASSRSCLSRLVLILFTALLLLPLLPLPPPYIVLLDHLIPRTRSVRKLILLLSLKNLLNLLKVLL